MKNGEREKMQCNTIKTRDFNIFVFVGSENRKKIEMKSNIFV